MQSQEWKVLNSSYIYESAEQRLIVGTATRKADNEGTRIKGRMVSPADSPGPHTVVRPSGGQRFEPAVNQLRFLSLFGDVTSEVLTIEFSLLTTCFQKSIKTLQQPGQQNGDSCLFVRSNTEHRSSTNIEQSFDYGTSLMTTAVSACSCGLQACTNKMSDAAGFEMRPIPSRCRPQRLK
jgi:hypothetical protein